MQGADYSAEPFTVQPNPHVSTAQIEGKVRVSGYAGFVPTIASDNVRAGEESEARCHCLSATAVLVSCLPIVCAFIFSGRW